MIALGTVHPTNVPAAWLPETMNARIIWLSEPGPGGGGGGGGNQMPEPPRPAELPGKDKLSVPVAEPPKLEPPKQPEEPDPVEQLNIPAKSLAAATESLPGAIEAPPAPPSDSQGPGAGGGAGIGTGSGIGPGSGSGLGPGSGGGSGGGVYRPGNGVTLPRLLREVKPDYTTDAMRGRFKAPCCSSASSISMERLNRLRWFDHSIRPSASISKRSKPPSSGVLRLAPGWGSQWRSW